MLAVISGASSGIGRATALKFAREGWTVVVVARTRAALEALAAEVPGRIIVEACDAGDSAAVEALAARVLAQLGVPDVVVNSAGLGTWKWLEDTTGAELETMLGAPFLAAAHLSRVFVGPMVQRRSGVILHVGSPASLQPWPGSTAYAASRWALRGLHEALRVDLAGTGVQSCHVVFGEVTSSYFSNNPDSHDHIPKIGRIIPVSTPEYCAEVLWKTARRPRPEVYAPAMVWALWWIQWMFPAIFRALVVRTGRRRS
jgi:short-subunit dehydrogenase